MRFSKRTKSSKRFGAAVSIAAALALTLTSFPAPIPVQAASDRSDPDYFYLEEFPENDEGQTTAHTITYDAAAAYQVVMPGDTVYFTPDEIELVEDKGYYDQTVLRGSGVVDFLPVQAENDSVATDNELDSDDFIYGEPLQAGVIKSNGPDYQTQIIESESVITTFKPVIGFVNNTGKIIQLTNSTATSCRETLMAYDVSGQIEMEILSVNYFQQRVTYYLYEPEYAMNFYTDEASASWQGADEYLPEKCSLVYDEGTYNLDIPAPVVEGKHFSDYTCESSFDVLYAMGEYRTWTAKNWSVKGQSVQRYVNRSPLLPVSGENVDETISYKATYTDGPTLMIHGNGGTVDGLSSKIAEVDVRNYANERLGIYYAGTKQNVSVEFPTDFEIKRDGFTVAGWYYIVTDDNGETIRRKFYGFEDQRSIDDYENIFGTSYAFTIYPVWVDSDGNYSDPNTGLTTPLEEQIERRVSSIGCRYSTDITSYEDGFIIVSTPFCEDEDGQPLDAVCTFEPLSDDVLKSYEQYGVYFMDERVTEAGYDAGTIAAFVKYDGSWPTRGESAWYADLMYDVGELTFTYKGIPYKTTACVKIPDENTINLENSATGEYAATSSELYIWFKDRFHSKEDYTLYAYNDLKSSAAEEIDKELASDEKALACFTVSLSVKSGNGIYDVKNQSIELTAGFDHETFEPCDDYRWYAFDGYKKGVVLDLDFNSGGIATNIPGSGTYLLVGVTNSKDISKATISSIGTQAYTGSKIEPAVTVKYDGAVLKAGTDYTVAYKNNIKVGTATVTITGKGEYSGTVTKTFKIKNAALKYRAYVQKKSWMSWQQALVSGSKASGTAGVADMSQNLRMETIQMQLSGVGGSVEYRAYCQKKGWVGVGTLAGGWATTANKNTSAGTKGESRRVEMIQLRAKGEVSTLYDIYYRTYCEKFGWLGWAKNLEKAGTAGYALKLEAFQVNLVPKGAKFTLTSARTKSFYDVSKDGKNPK